MAKQIIKKTTTKTLMLNKEESRRRNDKKNRNKINQSIHISFVPDHYFNDDLYTH